MNDMQRWCDFQNDNDGSDSRCNHSQLSLHDQNGDL